MNRIALVLVVALAACGGPAAYRIVGNQAWFEQDQAARAALAKRAAFDFDCPEPSLRYQQAGASWTTVGVEGCSKRSTYVYDYYRGAWLLNADTHTAAK